MRLIRRAALSLGVAVSAGATLTIATVGAAGGFGAGAGTFSFSDTSAFVSTFNPIDQSSINLNVDRSTFISRQRPAGTPQTQAMTTLSITQFIPNPDPTMPPTINSTCLVIPDSDFVVGSDLQTASLNVVNESTPCGFFKVPVSGGAIDVKAIGGAGPTIPLPLSATVTWVGTGAVGVSDTNGTFRCLTFVAITHDRNQQALSSSVSGSITSGAAFSISFSGGQSSGVFGAVAMNASTQTVAGRGILPAACGGGKGGA
jgi:hypothetical protein